MSNRFLAGLDLGQAKDHTALIITEAVAQTAAPVREVVNGTIQVTPARELPTRYDVRHIERFKLGTPYPAIVEHVTDLLHEPMLGGDVALIIDGTGVGRPVVDLFTAQRRRRFGVHPVLITAGDGHTASAGWYHVAKRDLIGVVQVLLQTERVRFGTFPETPILTSELQNYRVKVTPAANETFNARAGTHDDLVLALALAVWYGERGGHVGFIWL